MTLLAPVDYRALRATSLGDAALLVLLDAAESAILARYGPTSEITEIHDGGGRFLLLDRPASAIAAITETLFTDVLTLETGDWLLRSDARSLERLESGPNGRAVWYGRVAVRYTPLDDTADRKRVQLELVSLDIVYQAGLASQSIGDWSESYDTSKPYPEAREEILASLGGVAWSFA